MSEWMDGWMDEWMKRKKERKEEKGKKKTETLQTFQHIFTCPFAVVLWSFCRRCHTKLNTNAKNPILVAQTWCPGLRGCGALKIYLPSSYKLRKLVTVGACLGDGVMVAYDNLACLFYTPLSQNAGMPMTSLRFPWDKLRSLIFSS